MPDPDETTRPHEEVLDEVYRRHAASDPFLPITHFLDHTTMGAEALVALGLGDRVEAWASRHRVRPYDPPTTGAAIATDWPRALGRRDCHGDWLRDLEAELSTRPYRDVLATWVPRLAHDVGAFLFHGLIRTAHATRALAHRDTPARRAELARGLALWAVGVRPPPRTAADADTSGLTPHRADFLGFARVGAVTFLAAPNVPAVHLITGPMAYLMLATCLDETTHRLARASFARTHAAAAARFPALRDRMRAAPTVALDPNFMAALAEQRDAHPCKLTEAALRAHAEADDPLFLKAAGQALHLHGLRALLGVARAALTRRVA